MRLTTRITCLIATLLLGFPVMAAAIPAITCHCFKERAFDPARPSLADPYFLATSQNSFFAAVFAIDKKGLVMKKQQGASADDLWIAYWLAGKGAAASAEAVLQVRQRKGSWQETVASLGTADKTLGPRFAASLQSRASAENLAENIVDELLVKYRLSSEAEVATLRKSGSTNQELILAALIAARTRQPAIRLFREVKSGAKSWGALLDTAKISPASMQQEFATLINRSR
jgi:hypothetical protein